MKSIQLALLFGLAVCAVAAADASGQQASDPVQTESEALRVFVDCRTRYCDWDYMRRELTFINYVRDREVAQVHVLVALRSQETTGNSSEPNCG